MSVVGVVPQLCSNAFWKQNDQPTTIPDPPRRIAGLRPGAKENIAALCALDGRQPTAFERTRDAHRDLGDNLLRQYVKRAADKANPVAVPNSGSNSFEPMTENRICEDLDRSSE